MSNPASLPLKNSAGSATGCPITLAAIRAAIASCRISRSRPRSGTFNICVVGTPSLSFGIPSRPLPISVNVILRWTPATGDGFFISSGKGRFSARRCITSSRFSGVSSVHREFRSSSAFGQNVDTSRFADLQNQPEFESGFAVFKLRDEASSDTGKVGEFLL